ncbi:50S ribosomal protein L21 [Candidatus Woesebacteria bacterium]|nr:50S ribosomal protein L21 [Candidatus Woesebacteria bacterium]
MSYAVIQLQGKQFLVEPGTILEVDRLENSDAKEIKITDVLLAVTDKNVTVGAPLVPKAVVTAEVIEDLKGKKIRVATYKSKSRYRRVKGHRQLLTKLKVVSVETK